VTGRPVQPARSPEGAASFITSFLKPELPQLPDGWNAEPLPLSLQELSDGGLTTLERSFE